MRGDRFTAEEKARDFAYYEPITVRDSSLSACVQAVVAAEVGHLELAYDYFGEAALMDLGDLMDNTRDGLHIASLAGSWIAAVAGFGGMRDHGGELTLPPAAAGRAHAAAVPRHVPRRCLRSSPHARRLRAADGEPLEIRHDGEPSRPRRASWTCRTRPEPSSRRAASRGGVALASI